jgi:hypothetical protein
MARKYEKEVHMFTDQDFETFLKNEEKVNPGKTDFAITIDPFNCPIAQWYRSMGFTSICINTTSGDYTDKEGKEHEHPHTAVQREFISLADTKYSDKIRPDDTFSPHKSTFLSAEKCLSILEEAKKNISALEKAWKI